MADVGVAGGVLDTRLEIVRRGYDPQQVKLLVGQLSAELRALDQENTSLRQELDLAKLSASVRRSRATDDIINSWTRETNEMLDGARQHVARIMEKANADAASVLGAAETDAALIRQQARADAERIVAAANASAEQRAATIVADAEQQADDEAASAQTIRADAQTELTRATAEAQRLRNEVAELEQERQALREQFVNMQMYLQGLVALIEPPVNKAAP